MDLHGLGIPDECCAIALAPGLERLEVELDQPFATRCVRGR
jgi:hypothetical protein